MTSSSQTNLRRCGVAGAFLATLAFALLSGCIADTAEDSDLPWASNKGWEGIAPIAPTMSERYE